MDFVGGIIGMALVVVFLLLIGFLQVCIALKTWIVGQMRRRRTKKDR